jgi:hypothetical protein
MSKRAQRRIAAAEETCRALRKAIAVGPRADWDSVVDYLQVWMRNAGTKRKYDDPKPLRKNQKTDRDGWLRRLPAYMEGLLSQTDWVKAGQPDDWPDNPYQDGMDGKFRAWNVGWQDACAAQKEKNDRTHHNLRNQARTA